MPTLVDTSRIRDRRKLRFDSADAVMHEVQRLVELDRDARLERMGNWTLVQILGHLTASVDNCYNPLPLVKPPWIMRFVARRLRSIFLRNGLRAGFRVRRADGEMFIVPLKDADEGVLHYRRALDRLERQAPSGRHVMFGALSHREWMQFHLRHAELHLSFLRERSA